MATRPTQMRLTSEDRRKIEDIRMRAGLPSAAAAVRHAIDFAYVYWGTPGMHLTGPRKSRKKSENGA